MKNFKVKILLLLVSFSMLITTAQLINDRSLLAMTVLGLFLLVLGFTSKTRRRTRIIGIMLGLTLVIIAMFSTIGFWFAIAITLVALALFGNDILPSFSGKNNGVSSFWNKKEYRAVKTVEPSGLKRRSRQQWIGSQEVGEDIYEWDDINIITFAGDTIIDLGNTILPRDENIILIRKGVGKIRVIVPLGVGVALHHSTILGQVTFEGVDTEVKNEVLEFQSKGYSQAKKKVLIYTTILVGSVEVIEL